ncbi:hypothetical protein [Pontibacter beigongshangensis]|uniref:hypothetical protein n=1 Tax=Pontibacter beigongshangensis TaxID=2574733 RepID=UPI00164F40AA|nr:hypothetical protein [Pontibacter beigongshangensis]
MNRVFIISLLALMLLQTFSKVLLVVDYQANKEYIMEFLCINRDKPELACEGKCQLTKNLKEQEQAEKQGGDQTQAKEVQVNLFCQIRFSCDFTLFISKNPAIPSLVSGHTLTPSFAFFHPPKSVV